MPASVHVPCSGHRWQQQMMDESPPLRHSSACGTAKFKTEPRLPRTRWAHLCLRTRRPRHKLGNFAQVDATSQIHLARMDAQNLKASILIGRWKLDLCVPATKTRSKAMRTTHSKRRINRGVRARAKWPRAWQRGKGQSVGGSKCMGQGRHMVVPARENEGLPCGQCARAVAGPSPGCRCGSSP